MKTIQTGAILTATDSNCKSTAKVIERKGNFVSVLIQGEIVRKKIYFFNGKEYVYLLHSKYSMCPILTIDKKNKGCDLVTHIKTNTMKKVKITNYTKSVIASIQYGDDPANYYYNLDENAKGFALELIKLIQQGATIEIETLEFKAKDFKNAFLRLGKKDRMKDGYMVTHIKKIL